MPNSTQSGSTVTGAGIVDETISNSDIAPNAAIEASKLDLANQVGTAELEDDVLSVVTVELSSADILAIHNTPKTLVAAPGAGKVVIVENLVFSLDAGTQYANGETVAVSYDGLTSPALVSSIGNSSINSATDIVLQRVGVSVDVTAGINKAVTMATANPTAFTTGTGTARVFLKYRVITL